MTKKGISQRSEGVSKSFMGNSRFKYIYRGFKDALVLIPGWATDYRIFSSLDLNYNYLLPVKFNLLDFKKKLREELERNCLNKVSIFGYSLGGFLAGEFFKDNPERINKLILVSIRKKYNPVLLEEIAIKLKKNKKAYLYKFYLNCFSDKDKIGVSWFKEELLKDYLDAMTLPELLRGLEYLSGAELQMGALKTFKKLTIIHGKDDIVAPFREAVEIKSELPQVEFIGLPDSGHIPFLSRKFEYL